MSFRLAPRDFALCVARRRSSKELSQRFIELRIEVTRAFEGNPDLKRFVRYKSDSEVTSSPYVPNYWIWSGGGYREGSWIGFADRRFIEPRAGLQFEFVIRSDRVDFEIWLEGVYNRDSYSTKPVEERLYRKLSTQRPGAILSRLKGLGEDYWIWAKKGDRALLDEYVSEADPSQIQGLLDELELGGVSIALGVSIPKNRALMIQNVPKKIVALTLELLPFYKWWTGGGRIRIPRGSKGKGGSRVRLGDMTRDEGLEYKVRTRSKVRMARKKEAELVMRYSDWLKSQGRELSVARYSNLRCDAYEKDRNNLIEAKSSVDREYIRMAAGQLLDYSFQGREKLGKCNMAILLPKKPEPGSVKWLSEHRIYVVWESKGEFVDDADGLFT